MLLPLLLAQVALAADPVSIDASAIDRTCQPCQDFYQFAVGAWNAKHPIPANQSRWGKRWAAADTNLEILYGIAQTTQDRTIRAFYDSCMDTASLDKAGTAPIQPLWKRIEAIATREALTQSLPMLAREGLSAPLLLMPRPHPDDPSRVVAAIAIAPWSLPDRDYFLGNEPRYKTARDKFIAYGEKLFTLAGWDAARSAAAIRTVLALETAMARAQMTRVEYRDPQKTTNLRTLAELQKMIPHYDWPAYLRAIGVDANTTFVVTDPGAVAEVERQLASAPIADWKVWFQWRALNSAADHLSAPIRQESFAFKSAFLQGQKEAPPRWKQCVSNADAMLGDTMGQAYAAKVFPPSAKARMEEMIANLRAALDESIRGLEWMTPETKQKALAKLATFDPKVGYPDPWRLYKGEAPDADYFRNVRRAASARQLESWSQIGKPLDRTRWGMTVPTSNAYYNPSRNEIVFPAGILTSPMFHPNAEDAANYGAIGVVIGHEISHGYDDSGSQYDATGRLRNWWTPLDRKQFLDRAQCIVDQFNGYEIEPGVRHNGKLVLGESIGDLAGARIAFAAYLRSLRGKPTPPVIDGFTHIQRFFISWGQSRGDSTRIEEQRRMVVIDPHPVARYRVIGPLSNMPEFHQAFGCKRGDAMVRDADKQCRVW